LAGRETSRDTWRNLGLKKRPEAAVGAYHDPYYSIQQNAVHAARQGMHRDSHLAEFLKRLEF
jgi:hypothetical protein